MPASSGQTGFMQPPRIIGQGLAAASIAASHSRGALT